MSVCVCGWNPMQHSTHSPPCGNTIKLFAYNTHNNAAFVLTNITKHYHRQFTRNSQSLPPSTVPSSHPAPVRPPSNNSQTHTRKHVRYCVGHYEAILCSICTRHPTLTTTTSASASAAPPRSLGTPWHRNLYAKFTGGWRAISHTYKQI